MTKLQQYKSIPIHPSEITPEHLYHSRRQFIRSLGIVSAAALLAACNPGQNTSVIQTTEGLSIAPSMEYNDTPNTYEEITTFNNFYEFTTEKRRVATLANSFQSSPWKIEVYGLVNKPTTFGMEDLLKKFTQEERIYRMRCVEGWSMVIPWMGFPLASLLKEVEPLSTAKYVRFETLMDREQMPGCKINSYPWPYEEGLRLDEAMHDLTILSTGLYGKPHPPQMGAPIRLVVPWKYGFKSIKSIIKIELVEKQPDTFWSLIAPNEYGFYANVNPTVDHPRWSQATERRVGEKVRRPTLMFNGYAEEVAYLYEGLDLSKYY